MYPSENTTIRFILAGAMALACSSRAFALELSGTKEQGTIMAQGEVGIFGDLTDGGSEFDSDETQKVRTSPAYRRAFESAKKRFCTEGRIQFSFTWEGEIEIHGCGDIENRCYQDFKVIPPGSVWKCAGGMCRCLESGDIQLIPSSHMKK